jgi:transposase-like protein
LILDGTVVKVRLDHQATAISLLIVLGVRRDGQKVVLAVKNTARRWCSPSRTWAALTHQP